MRTVAYHTVYVLAVLAIACGAVLAASLLPIGDPGTATGVCIAAGCFAGAAAIELLPCPCCRKERP